MLSASVPPKERPPQQREIPLGFCFRVEIEGKKADGQAPDSGQGQSISNITLDFQSVSGLNREIVTESFREGGQLHDYALPTKVQYSDIVLKRGLWIKGTGAHDALHLWLKAHESNFLVEPRNVIIKLLRPRLADKNSTVLFTWNVKNAWPKKWSVSDFNAEENQVVIETLELHYDSFTVV